MTATGEQETNLEPNVAYYENWYPPFKHFGVVCNFLPSLSNHEKRFKSSVTFRWCGILVIKVSDQKLIRYYYI